MISHPALVLYEKMTLRPSTTAERCGEFAMTLAIGRAELEPQKSRRRPRRLTAGASMCSLGAILPKLRSPAQRVLIADG